MAKILLIDDSVVDRMVVRKTLEKDTHEVFECDNPADALLTIGEVKPDLVLLDVVMPEVNGYEVCRLLKRQSSFSRLPIIFLSSRSRKSDIFWGLQQGAEDYLTKPVNSAVLLETVNKWLGNKLNVGIDG